MVCLTGFESSTVLKFSFFKGMMADTMTEDHETTVDDQPVAAEFGTTSLESVGLKTKRLYHFDAPLSTGHRMSFMHGKCLIRTTLAIKN